MRLILTDETGVPCPVDIRKYNVTHRGSGLKMQLNCAFCGLIVERAQKRVNVSPVCFYCKKKRHKETATAKYQAHKVEPRCAEANCKSHKTGKWSPDYQKAIKDLSPF